MTGASARRYRRQPSVTAQKACDTNKTTDWLVLGAIVILAALIVVPIVCLIDTGGDGGVTDDNGCVPTEELCNGLDDDCNTLIDEPFQEQLNVTCAEGVGECYSEGFVICNALQPNSTVCDAEEGEPQQELCNGLDDNCDGWVDEAFQDLGEACALGVGECRREGERVCSSSSHATVCDAVPGAEEEELCNGLDDDCNGEVDSDAFPELGQQCVVGEGECRREGSYQCREDGHGTYCDATAGSPSDELCNGLDDDCDGLIDELFPDVGLPCIAGVGECHRVGLIECQADNLAAPPVCGAIRGMSRMEMCNGLDDDCDGTVDEGFFGGAFNETCAVGVGECRRQGRLVCMSNEQGAYCDAAPGAPGDELCNGVDDDCDRLTDEGFDALGAYCETGLGACHRNGSIVCAADGLDEVCSVQPGEPAEQEICDNGIDDDCNGLTDCEDELACGGMSCDFQGAVNMCAMATECIQGECVATDFRNCDDDGNACTENDCNTETGECLNTPLRADTPCSDASVCTIGDVCDGAGNCAAGVELLECGDSHACTRDSCDPVFGCMFKVDSVCDTQTPNDCCPEECTSETDADCLACGADGDCIDEATCTLGFCDARGTCRQEVAPNSSPCNDDNVCTSSDQCYEGVCLGGNLALDCDNGNACTADFCDPVDGCVHELIVNCCGNGIVEAGETCEGDDASQCGNGVYECNADACACILISLCGNGILEDIEQCDDNNTLAGDGCNSECMLEFCGNEMVDAGEQCDGALAAQCGDQQTCSVQTCECIDPVELTGDQCVDDLKEPNDAASNGSATALGHLDINTLMLQSDNLVVCRDNLDFYGFTIDAATCVLTIDVSFAHANGDVDARLYYDQDPSGSGAVTLVDTADSVTDNEQLIVNTSVATYPTGTFFLRVYGKAAPPLVSNNYALQVVATLCFT